MAAGTTQAAETSEKWTAQWLMRQTDPLRTSPVPNGLGLETPVIEKTKEWMVKFNMIDEENIGALDRRQSRNFLRTCGWCVSYEILDEMLWDTPVGKEVQRKIDMGLISKQEASSKDNPKLGMWKCDDLVKLMQDPRNCRRENGSLEVTQGALRRLAHGRNKIDRTRLLQVLRDYHGVTEDDVNQTLERCGIGSYRELLDCDGLAHSMLKRVASPLNTREFDLMCEGATIVNWNYEEEYHAESKEEKEERGSDGFEEDDSGSRPATSPSRRN